MNTIGHFFRLTTFGESHGVAIGGIIDTVKLSRSIYRGILGKKKEAKHG